MMIEIIDIEQLYDFEGLPLIDVRSPSEYALAHIPGAVNIPLFDDEERARVGTRYHNSGKDAGFMLGLEIAGPKLAGYLKKLNSLFPVKSPLVIYCWRGGMRSGAMGWLFAQAGHDVYVINGGYKAFRGYIREKIATAWDYIVIGGMTGSGKTEYLKKKKEEGCQVIDLEELACHKGSVFGHLGQQEQPNNEWFENILWEALRKMDPAKPVYLEDESRSIGRVSLSESFYMKMQHSPLVMLEVDMEERISRLVNDYGAFPQDELILNINKLEKYIGLEANKRAVEAVSSGDLATAVRILLNYYDKKYKESVVRYRGKVGSTN
ncbi:MAG: tRNA 2-selenouridine(34) synthase MnmH [Chloroflexota bacterium]